jgi:hypothetical protein
VAFLCSGSSQLTRVSARQVPPLPAAELLKHQWTPGAPVTLLNTVRWSVVVRDVSGASLEPFVYAVTFELPRRRRRRRRRRAGESILGRRA